MQLLTLAVAPSKHGGPLVCHLSHLLQTRRINRDCNKEWSPTCTIATASCVRSGRCGLPCWSVRHAHGSCSAGASASPSVAVPGGAGGRRLVACSPVPYTVRLSAGSSVCYCSRRICLRCCGPAGADGARLCLLRLGRARAAAVWAARGRQAREGTAARGRGSVQHRQSAAEHRCVQAPRGQGWPTRGGHYLAPGGALMGGVRHRHALTSRQPRRCRLHPG